MRSGSRRSDLRGLSRPPSLAYRHTGALPACEASRWVTGPQLTEVARKALQGGSRGESSFRPRDLDPLTSSTHTPLAPHQKHQKRQKYQKRQKRQKDRSEGIFSAPKATNLGLNRGLARPCQKVVSERSFCNRLWCIDGVPSKE
jgi:hypothetical protein